MAQVKFVRGNKITKRTSWNSKITANSIAFDKDNKEIYLGSDKYSQTKLTELTNDNAALLVGDSLNVAFSKLNNIIEDNEEVTAEALNDLNDRKVNTEDLATVATTGSYNDLTDKPATFTFDSIPTENSTNPVTSGGLYTVITKNEKTTAAALNDLNNRKVNTTDLAAVATSGSYNDLTNKPIIPTIPNLSKGTTTGSGNAVTDIAVNGHTIKLTKGTTFASLASPTFTGIPKAPTAATGTNSTQIATTEFVQTAVQTAVNGLPEPMIFKGTVGTDGTIATLPAAAATNEGHTYKVISALSSPAAKIGDTVISNGSSWVVIPSGDEPSGTVTSVKMTVPTGLSVSGSPITSSGTLAVTYASGYSIPTTAKQTEWDGKQAALVSGTNIKTVNSNSLLGSGNISIATPGTLNTNNTTAQTVPTSAEALSGAIKLHKIAKTGTYSDLIGTPSLATVATSGSYTDLSNKPSIPAAPGTLSTNNTSAQTVPTTAEALSGAIKLHKVSKTGSYDDLNNKPTIPAAPGTLVTNKTTAQTASAGEAMSGTINLHKVAKTGTYSDLIGTPTIGNATLTIQKNGTTVKTFTANATSDVTANITVPTKVSDLTNDSGFISSYTESDPVFLASAASGITSTDITNWNSKQAALVGSGTGQNIKTVNNNSLLGSGNVSIATPGTLNTNNTTAQTANSSEALSGAINLHKISKTGSYNDLIGKPDLTQYDEVVEGAYLEGHGFTTYSYNQTTGYSYVVNPVTYTGKTGTLYVDTITNTIYRYDGSKYVLLYIFSGNSTNRPLDNLIVGQSYFDTTLGLPIWWNGTAWVDALGNTPGSKNYVYVENN